MRWDDLFDDLESQLEQELGAEDVDLLAEEERLRLGRLTLRDRLLAMTRPAGAAGGASGAGSGDEVRLALRDGQLLSVSVGSIGRDWLVGELRGLRRGSCLVPSAGSGACCRPPRNWLAASRATGHPNLLSCCPRASD